MKIMNKKAKIILSSVSSIAICASLIVGSTFALFVTNSAVDAKLTSAKVGVSANIDNLTTYEAKAVTDGDDNTEYLTDKDGSKYVKEGFNYIYSEANSTANESGEIGFGLGGTVSSTIENGVTTLNIKDIAPGDKVTFTVNLTNYSTITSKYRFGISTINDDYTDSDVEFLSRLKITVNDADYSGIKSYVDAWSGDIDAASKDNSDNNLLKAYSVSIEYPVWYEEDVNGITDDPAQAAISFYAEAVQGNMAVSDSPATYEYLDIFSKGIDTTKVEKNETGVTISNKSIDTNATEVVIPAAVNGVPVTEIDERTFAYNNSLNSVVIPGSVTEIGDDAFEQCTSLTNLTINEGVTTIGVSAFANCTALKEVTIPSSVNKIGYSSFISCTSLEKVTIEDNVKEIGAVAFSGCTSLKTINLPASITKIGSGAFVTGNDSLEIIYAGYSASWLNIVDVTKTTYTLLQMDLDYNGCDTWDEYVTKCVNDDGEMSDDDIKNEYDSYIEKSKEMPLCPFYAWYTIGQGSESVEKYLNSVTVTCSDATINYTYDGVNKNNENKTIWYTQVINSKN
jgi:hypothetical protein